MDQDISESESLSFPGSDRNGDSDSSVTTPGPASLPLPVRAFQPQALIAGLCLVVATAALAWLLGAPSVGVLTGVSVAVLLVGTILLAWETQRWEQNAQAYADANMEIEKWQEKYRALYSDARQTVTAFSHMLDGLIMVSPEGSILLMNESAQRLLGLPGDADLMGRRFPEVVRVPEIN